MIYACLAGECLENETNTPKELYGFPEPPLFLAESSAKVCNFESQQKETSLEIRQKCWQTASRKPESVSRKARQKKKSARFC